MDPLDNMSSGPVPKNFNAEAAENNEDVRKHDVGMLWDCPLADFQYRSRSNSPSRVSLKNPR